MQGSQEVGCAGQIHKSTQSLSAKDPFTASAGEPVKASNEFEAFETELLFKLLDFFLVFGVVVLS